MIVLAHQGGWDEILVFVVVGLAAVAALRKAEQHASQRRAKEGKDPDSKGESAPRGVGPPRYPPEPDE